MTMTNNSQPVSLRLVLRRWWMLPVFLGLIAWEIYEAVTYERNPKWIWLALGVAGLIFLIFVRLDERRRR
jgi:hypothetical protein